MKKLDISDFFVENKIVTTSEQGVVYDLPKDKMEETWDALSLFYKEKSKQEFKSEALMEEFHNHLSHAKVENEIAKEAIDLTSINVLKFYDSAESKDAKFNIKRVILKDLIAILEKRLSELKENIKDEELVYEKIKNIKYDIKIVDGALRAYKTPFKYTILINLLTKSTDLSLTCTLIYRGKEYKGSFEPDQIYLIDIDDFIGQFNRKDIQITIVKESTEKKDFLSLHILKELFKGTSIDNILKNTPLLLSRFYSNDLCKESKRKTIVQTNTNKLIDGVSAIFYILIDDGVVKVSRCEESFQILLNGEVVDI